MTTRTLELNLRAKADTKDLEKLSRSTAELVAAVRRSSAAFDDSTGDARKLAAAFSQLSAEEQKSVAAAARTAAALDQAATARERTARAAADALAAEQRITVAQQAAEQATIKTAVAQERLAQSQASTSVSISRAASAEEKLAQERQRTFQATAKSEKAELDIARAREQLRAATARAEQAEKRMAEARKSSGLATDIVHKQLQALVTGGAAIAAGRQLIQFGRDSISAASDAEEAAAKFEQVFRTAAAGVREDLEVMAEANRRSVYDLVDFASTLQDTFVPLGFARDAAAEMSKTVVQLGIDIAAFSNRADSEVIDNLTSALVGNHEAVRSYGIVLTETVLKQELARLGYSDLTGAALETAKAQARLNIIMRASADAQGAAVREAGSYANTLKAWDAATQDLKVSLGQGLLPMMTQLVEIAIEAAEVLKAGSGFATPFEEGIKAAETTEDIVKIVRQSKKELDDLDFWEWAKVNSTSWAGLDMAEMQIERLAKVAKDAAEFQRIVISEFSRIELNEFAFERGLPSTWDLEAQAQDIYRYIQALEKKQQAERDTAEMEAIYEQQRQKIISTDASQVTFVEAPKPDVIAGWAALADDLGRVYENSAAAAAAQLELNTAFGAAFQSAPVDALISAQQDLSDATGEWRNVTVDRSSQVAGIQAQLAADLTAEQKKALQKQLKDLDEFSSGYMAIMSQLEADLSDSQRFDLVKQLSELEGQQGQTARVYSGDIEAAEEARDAIREANQAIVDSYYDRAYNAIAARMIEEGNFEQLAAVAVSLGIMTQAEADLRMEYAQTVGALDELSQSTEFYGLTAGQQAGAIKSLAAGIYETADAALQAQRNLKATQDFYNTAPDSTAISNYYTQLAAGAGADTGISTQVSVVIDPETKTEFLGFRSDLEDYDAAIYETTVQGDYGTTKDDFENIHDTLKEITAKPWIIQVKYETTGSPAGSTPGSNSTGPTGPLPQEERSGVGRSGAYVDLTVNNYGSGDISGAVKTGVMAAFRSIG
jgi:hypothetical protein